MSHEFAENDDSLLNGLAGLSPSALGGPPADGGVRAALLERTTEVVRGRARRRRVLIAAGWACAYAAGIATAWLPTRTDESLAGAPPVGAAQVQNDAPTDEVPSLEELDPVALRRRVAEVPLAERPMLLRAAGDRYLIEWNDIAGAVHCYQQLLELETLTGPTVAAGNDADTWLLAELRRSRRPLEEPEPES